VTDIILKIPCKTITVWIRHYQRKAQEPPGALARCLLQPVGKKSFLRKFTFEMIYERWSGEETVGSHFRKSFHVLNPGTVGVKTPSL
jgi:hypothetical protein